MDGRQSEQDSSSEDEERGTKRRKTGSSSQNNQLCEFPDEANTASDPYGSYKGTDERLNVFKWNFTRKLVHFYLSLKTDIPSKVKEVFYASNRKHFCEPSPLETECLTLPYTIHAFFATVTDLEEFTTRPYPTGLQYEMRWL